MNRGLSLDICIFGCSIIVLKEYGRNPVQFRHGRPFIGAGCGQSWAITGVVCLTRLAGSMSLDVAIYMGYINGAVVGIPFAPPTLGRFYLPSAGVWLKLSRLHITVLNYRAIYSLRGLLLSFSTTFIVFMHTVQGGAYVQCWDPPRVASPTLGFTQAWHNWKWNKLTTELEFYLPALSSKRNRPL